MKEKSTTYNIELLTPCFCKIGENCPEIRGASIRGMIREWKRLVGGNPDIIWGGKSGNASKIGIDLKKVETTTSSHQLLPHKGGTTPKALNDGGTFTLVINRLVGCSDQMWQEAKQDVTNWLLLGCLGQRANRAAGSVWCEDWFFTSLDEFKNKISVSEKCDIRVSNAFTTASEARETASDTVEILKYFGSFKPRTPSPTKMKIIKINENFHILFFAKGADILDGAINALKTKPDPHRWINVEFTKI